MTGRHDGSLVGSELADQFLHGGGVGGDLLRCHVDAGLAHQHLSLLALFGQHDGDDVTRAAGSRRAPGAVQVCLVLGGRIDVNDQLDFVDVNATRRNVGGHQHLCLTRGERCKVAVACRLRKVAVQVN